MRGLPIAIPFLVSIVAAPPVTHSSVDLHPVFEFSYVNDDTAPEANPVLEDCGYYLRIRGTLGRSITSRVGAHVQLRGDTLFVRIDPYRASEFATRDWQMARWTLRIGNLGPDQYLVDVVAGPKRVTRSIRLSFDAGRCAA